MNAEQLEQIRARVGLIDPRDHGFTFAPSDVRALLEHIAELEAERTAIRKIIGVQRVERNGVQLTLPEIVQYEHDQWRDSAEEYVTAIADLRDSPGFRHEPDDIGPIASSALEVLHVAKREMARYAEQVKELEARLAESHT